MKKTMLAGVLAVMLAALVGFSATTVSAQQAPQTWTVGIHFEYADGFSFDILLGTGLTNQQKAEILSDCGRSHRTGSVVRYHCYAIAE